MRRCWWASLALGLVLLGPGPCAAAAKEAVKWHNFGAELLRQGQPDEAIPPLRQAVALDPTFVKAYLSLAVAHERLGHVDEAIAAYQQVTALDPTNATAFNNLAVLYAGQGHHDRAIQMLEQALRLDPANMTVRRNLARARETRQSVPDR